MPPKSWKTVLSKEVYKNPWIRVREDIAELPNGKRTLYGIIEPGCGHCVGVLPFVDDERVMMVRQYRYAFDENHRWEMPTGGVHTGEELESAARRELREEIGYDAGELQYISAFYTSKSVVQETAHLYLGRQLIRSKAIPDETEFLEVAVFPFGEVLQMVIDGGIRDAMTIIAVLHAARLRG